MLVELLDKVNSLHNRIHQDNFLRASVGLGRIIHIGLDVASGKISGVHVVHDLIEGTASVGQSTTTPSKDRDAFRAHELRDISPFLESPSAGMHLHG